jgi:hypothetical protein
MALGLGPTGFAVRSSSALSHAPSFGMAKLKQPPIFDDDFEARIRQGYPVVAQVISQWGRPEHIPETPSQVKQMTLEFDRQVLATTLQSGGDPFVAITDKLSHIAGLNPWAKFRQTRALGRAIGLHPTVITEAAQVIAIPEAQWLTPPQIAARILQGPVNG